MQEVLDIHADLQDPDLTMPLSTFQRSHLMENYEKVKETCAQSPEFTNVFKLMKLLSDRQKIFQVRS